jgi:Fe2+ or Zn2+ uptake regulation protein
MPKISLGTVYRNLSVLKEEGVIREIYGNDRRAHYDADLSPHAHFICTDCGQIWDVFGVPEIDWRTLKELVGCEVTNQQLDFQGRCAVCSLAAKNEGH